MMTHGSVFGLWSWDEGVVGLLLSNMEGKKVTKIWRAEHITSGAFDRKTRLTRRTSREEEEDREEVTPLLLWFSSWSKTQERQTKSGNTYGEGLVAKKQSASYHILWEMLLKKDCQGDRKGGEDREGVLLEETTTKLEDDDEAGEWNEDGEEL